MIKVFIGQYRYNIDSKGRVVIPLDYRRQMGNTIVLNKGFEKCITVYTLEGWEKFIEDAMSLDDFSEENRYYKRYLMTSAFSKELDFQGRINLDKSLIDFAEIQKDVVIVGAGKVIEIWSAENWQNIERKRDAELVQIGNKIALQKQKNV